MACPLGRRMTTNDQAPPWPVATRRNGAFFLLLLLLVPSAVAETGGGRVKAGRCLPLIDALPCAPDAVTAEAACAEDDDCPGRAKCCSDGCRAVCIDPAYSACEQQQLAAEKRARAMSEETVEDVPHCRMDGTFEPVQCNSITGKCWCINDAGFELPGTRASSKELVNCSAPQLCSGLMCRMLCPYDFELDDDGCPLCRCRDPCAGVRCPADEECHLEDIPCDREPCPPILSCKQARHLDSICPFGEPLFLSEKTQPFLCGLESTQPQCPPFFTCILQPNMDYGSCCPIFDHIEKPGNCPSSSMSVDQCGSECSADSECPGLMKCCSSEICEKHCVASNSTVCEQQRTLVELLSRNEKAGRGYIPECTETGEFQPKQCSRNHLVCWCVDVEGRKIPRTMGPAETVVCSEEVMNRSKTVCDDVECRVFCEYGFQLDENSCQTCDCAEPCEGFSCPDGSECIAVQDASCLESCPLLPSCQPSSDNYKKVGICPTKDEHACERGSACSDNQKCSGTQKCCILECGLRCVEPVTSSRLPTMCEYLHAYAARVANTSMQHLLAYSAPECTEDGMYKPVQCSDRGECWCVDEFGSEIPKTRVANRQLQDCSTAETRNHCLGLMCRLGCDYGFRKDEDGCPICECRNPCDGLECGEGRQCHLVEIDEDCGGGYCPPVPQCLSTSKTALVCPSSEPQVDSTYNSTLLCGIEDYACPETHFCLTDEKEVDLPGLCCLKTDDLCSEPQEQSICQDVKEQWFYNNAIGHCEVFGSCEGSRNYFATQTQCELICAVNKDTAPKNGTCPTVEPNEMGNCIMECAKDTDCRGPQKCCLNGCGAFVCREPKGIIGKSGQCPFLLPLHSNNCELQCKSDYDCIDDLKCCSNGCGTKCIQPEMKTACEHQKSIAEFKALEAGYPIGLAFIPTCREEDGGFAPVQCSIANQTCWCVDEMGKEVVGTRTYQGKTPDCGAPASCSVHDCDITCPYGPELDTLGCPTCHCRDPCGDMVCKENEECRLAQVKCVTKPCPPVPLCLPKLENPCSHGSPLIDATTGSAMRCGPEGQQCSSTHQCHLSPFGEFAVCCSKPRDACFQPRDVGQCAGNVPRWYFDPHRNFCDEFHYGSCGGNSNNFQSKEECEDICPPLSACERAREKNLWRMRTTQKDVFIPLCNPKTRDWESVQCLPSVGICWCVSQDGEIQTGTFTRGHPQCTARQGRKFIEGTSAVCTKNETVHVCPSNLCKQKVCLAWPEATCHINPCGGCRLEFYNDDGDQVDCNQGLTPCLWRMQHVLNSEAWANQQSLLPAKEMHVEHIVKRDIFSEAIHSFLMGLLPSDTDMAVDEVQEDLPSLEALPSPADEEQFYAPPRMGVWLPQCDIHGGYAPLQKFGPLGWCVNTNGEPNHRSLKRGRVQCDNVTNIMDSEARLTCQENSRIPRVCNDECLNAICSAHPDALCSADPCNNCKITFTNTEGEQLNCEDKCSQSLQVGVCKAFLPRWFFNQTSRQCEQFIYGGCQGNDNNFDSHEQCHTECEKPVDVCRQPKQVGMCRASMHRWFYNAATRKCEEFIFGGCDANDNNFETEEECSAICPDLVLCPHMDNNGELQQCSRVEACLGKMCLNHDDVVCTVDPCNNCSIYFVDLDGVSVKCNITVETASMSSSTEAPGSSKSSLEPLPGRTRCEKQHAWAEFRGGYTPVCDEQGQFQPTQCDDQSGNDLKTFCWCVDEAGNQLQESLHFVQGTRACEHTKVSKIEVTLMFSQPAGQQEMIQNETLVKEAILHLVQSKIPLSTDDIEVGLQSEYVIVNFTLLGEDKVDVAYALEEQIQHGHLLLTVAGHELPAVHSASIFRHLVPSNDVNIDDRISTTTLIIVILITLLAMLLTCSLITGVMMYRRKRMGTYPKGSLESLASSTSPLYESKKKLPYTISSLLHHFAGYENGKRADVSSVENEYATIVSKGKNSKDALM